MHAILAHRYAGGDEIDGQPFEHQRWTLVEALTPALEAAAVPEQGQTQPRLRIIELSPDAVDAEDPRLGGLSVVGHEPALAAGDPEEDIDLDQASLPALKKLAKLLGLSRSQGRADLIAAIREKHAALDQAEAEEAEPQPADTGEEAA